MKIYNKLLKIILLLFAVSLLLFPIPTGAYGSEITNGIKITIEAVIGVIKNEELQKKQKQDERRALLKEIISKKFSYYEMSRRALGKYWKEITPEEKKEFVELFGTLHDNSYAKKIESYSDEKIIFTEEKVRGNIALVKSLMQKDEDKIPVDYKLIKIGTEWKVYDFIIEGVSLLKNYRAQFSKIIRKSSFPGLVKTMKKKVERLHNEDDAGQEKIS